MNVNIQAVDVEQLVNRDGLPAVESQRPCSCPKCANPAHRPGGKLGIVGHGAYTRQVRGLTPGDWIVIYVQRFLCIACGCTFSLLPRSLHPGRLYLAGAMLRALVGALLLDSSTAELRETIGPGGRAPHWGAPVRWARQLGKSLWPRWASEIGNPDRLAPEVFLERLLAHGGCHARCAEAELDAAALRLARQGC